MGVVHYAVHDNPPPHHDDEHDDAPRARVGCCVNLRTSLTTRAERGIFFP